MARKPIWSRALLHFPTTALSFSSTTNQPTYTHLLCVPSLCKCALPLSSSGTPSLHPSLPPLTSSSFPPLRFPLSSGLSSMHHLHHLYLHRQPEHHHGHQCYDCHPCSFLILPTKISHSQAEYKWYELFKDIQDSCIICCKFFPAKFTLVPKTKLSPGCLLYVCGQCDGYGGRHIGE